MKEEDCLGGGILGEEAMGLSAGTAQGRPHPPAAGLRPWEGGEMRGAALGGGGGVFGELCGRH